MPVFQSPSSPAVATRFKNSSSLTSDAFLAMYATTIRVRRSRGIRSALIEAAAPIFACTQMRGSSGYVEQHTCSVVSLSTKLVSVSSAEAPLTNHKTVRGLSSEALVVVDKAQLRDHWHPNTQMNSTPELSIGACVTVGPVSWSRFECVIVVLSQLEILRSIHFTATERAKSRV